MKIKDIMLLGFLGLLTVPLIQAQESTTRPRSSASIFGRNNAIVMHMNDDGSSHKDEEFFVSRGKGPWYDNIKFRVHANGTISTTNGIHADWGALYLVADWDNSRNTEDIIFGFDGYQKDKIKEKMRLTDEGSLGIGTKSPKAKLHVNGNIYAKGQVYLYAYEGDNKSGTAYLQARDKSNSSSIGLQLRSQNAGTTVNALKIMPNGNIGIGTSSPTNKLDVKGNTHIEGNTTITGTTNLLDTKISGNTSVNGDLTMSNLNRAQELLIQKGLNIRLSNIENSHFSIQNAFGSDVVYIANNGKIAIGNPNIPELTEQLHVGGRIKASGFIADASSFPDYVFSKEYKLMTLQEIKEYTSKNHHLPGMPSEKEIISSGLDLKKVTTISVEKIEELYLHTIQQQELIEIQQQLIKRLEQRITRLEKLK